jgi:hypothetical protein
MLAVSPGEGDYFQRLYPPLEEDKNALRVRIYSTSDWPFSSFTLSMKGYTDAIAPGFPNSFLLLLPLMRKKDHIAGAKKERLSHWFYGGKGLTNRSDYSCYWGNRNTGLGRLKRKERN